MYFLLYILYNLLSKIVAYLENDPSLMLIRQYFQLLSIIIFQLYFNYIFRL